MPGAATYSKCRSPGAGSPARAAGPTANRVKTAATTNGRLRHDAEAWRLEVRIAGPHQGTKELCQPLLYTGAALGGNAHFTFPPEKPDFQVPKCLTDKAPQRRVGKLAELDQVPNRCAPRPTPRHPIDLSLPVVAGRARRYLDPRLPGLRSRPAAGAGVGARDAARRQA